MTPTTPRKKITIIMRFILFLSFCAALFFAIYFYRQYKEVTNEQVRAQKEIDTIKNDLSKLLVVPDEDPIIATVTDKTKLEQQAFFRQAENGDKVVIYQTSGKAVLFRPSINKIVDITVINISPDQQNSETSTTITATIYNGTATAGLAAKIQDEIIKNIQNINIVSVNQAKNSNYEKTIVIVNNQNAASKAQELATLLGANIENLPSEEQKPNSDILIIIGSDKTQSN